MAYQVTFEKEDGEQVVVNLDDLSPEVYDQIAKDSGSGLTYWGVYLNPRETPEILYRVLCAAAASVGIEPPDRAETMRDSLKLSALFSAAPDIEDEPMEGGFPKEPIETEIGSTSTSLDLLTDGPSTSPDDTP